MSPTDPNMPGIKGKKIPGKPGRFDPTEPLHMTTRRAAKTGPNNGSPSVNGSIDGDESRRGSIDESRPFTSHSNGSQFEVHNRRPSEASMASPDPEIATNGLFIPEENLSGEVISTAQSPTQQTPSPSRKRKRSSSPAGREEIQPEQSVENIVENSFDNTANNSFENDDNANQYEDEGDTVELVPPEDLSDREESPHSSQLYEEDDQPNDTFPNESMDITPAISNQGSPQSGESESPEKRSLEGMLEDVTQEAQDENAEVLDEMDIDVDAEAEADVEVDADVDAEGPDDAEDADEQLRSDEDERPVRRFGGRRRAQHPIAKVEKAMQRQAELKSAYRALARAQKVVLAEIAQRTVDNLENDPELHLRTFEYQGVKEGLDEALEERQYRLESQRDFSMEQLTENWEEQKRAVRAQFMQRLTDLKEDRLATLEFEMMRIVREAQTKSLDDGYLTDNEDGVKSMARPTALGRKARKYVNTALDSDSRETLETIRITDDMENRFEMYKLLDGLAEEDRVARPKAFTAMDDTPRKAASSRREGLEATKVLADAAKEFEKRSKKPVLANKDALGLQLLGDLASRPSIKAPTRDYTQAKRKGSMSQTPSRPLPPQLQIPTNHRPSPIPVEMSPRTTQALGDRFDNSMPPPVTPRQRPNLFMRSPEVVRAEQTLPSPTFNQNRFSASRDYPVRTPERWPDPRRTGHPDYPLAPPELPKQPEPRPGPQQSPLQSNERRVEYPLWREYPRESPSAQHRRSSSQNERPPFNFGAGLPGLPPREEKRDTLDVRMQNRAEGQDRLQAPPINRPPYWQSQPSQPGAADNQAQDQRSPVEPPRRSIMEALPPASSRNPSLSFTPREFQPAGLPPKDSNQQDQKYRGFKSIFQHKTSKEERDGLSRRNWSNQQRRLSKSIGNFRPAGSPPRTSSAGSPGERAPPSAPWNAPPAPQLSPPTVPPPPQPSSYQPSPYSQPPPPSSYRPTQQSQDYYQHRTSFTPRPASSNQDRLPPTPLYVVPQSQPPPPGVPAEQYNRPFAPPPPPGYQPPPPPPPPPPSQGSQPAYPPSSSGTSFSNQYGGPPLAPAGSAYHPLGTRAAPVFAQQQSQQQQQQQQSTFTNRRRTQSDASQLPKFQPWTPPTRR